METKFRQLSVTDGRGNLLSLHGRIQWQEFGNTYLFSSISSSFLRLLSPLSILPPRPHSLHLLLSPLFASPSPTFLFTLLPLSLSSSHLPPPSPPSPPSSLAPCVINRDPPSHGGEGDGWNEEGEGEGGRVKESPHLLNCSVKASSLSSICDNYLFGPSVGQCPAEEMLRWGRWWNEKTVRWGGDAEMREMILRWYWDEMMKWKDIEMRRRWWNEKKLRWVVDMRRWCWEIPRLFKGWLEILRCGSD